ncbi:MAG: hypothetical protein GVY23_03970 [Spirochaetes bacterium]|jgi:DNA-binding NarL/FixJ family response regulator|nr:hypothetical protein [Spirochaetota bacterium]
MGDRILVVDEEAMVADATVDTLARGEVFSLVPMDIWFGSGKTDRGHAAREIASRLEVPLVFYTGYDEEPALRRIDGVSSCGVMGTAPQSSGILVRAVRAAIARHREAPGVSSKIAAPICTSPAIRVQPSR